jgi:hypothetical protein
LTREVKIKVVRDEVGTELGKLALYDFVVSTRFNVVKRLSCMTRSCWFGLLYRRRKFGINSTCIKVYIDSEVGEKNYGSNV